MKKNTKWIIGASISTSLVVAAGLAIAAERHGKHHDTHGDKAYHGKFHKGFHQMRFGKGQMTLEGLQSSLNDRFTTLDKNGDGMVTAEEFSAQAVARFIKIDADGNGELTRSEIKDARKAFKEQRRGTTKLGSSKSDT